MSRPYEDQAERAADRHEWDAINILACKNERPGQGMVPLYAPTKKETT